MRHNNKLAKLSRSRAQRKALIRSLARNIFIYERIKTTPTKAKELSKIVDKIINWAKRGTLHSKRLIYQVIPDHKIVKRIADDFAVRYKNVNSGFTRIIKAGFRKGDGADLAFIEFTNKVEKKRKVVASESAKTEITEDKKKEEPTTKKGLKGIFKRKK